MMLDYYVVCSAHKNVVFVYRPQESGHQFAFPLKHNKRHLKLVCCFLCIKALLSYHYLRKYSSKFAILFPIFSIDLSPHFPIYSPHLFSQFHCLPFEMKMSYLLTLTTEGSIGTRYETVDANSFSFSQSFSRSIAYEKDDMFIPDS